MRHMRWEAFMTETASVRAGAGDPQAEATASEILAAVLRDGDDALCSLTARLDGVCLTVDRIEVDPGQWDEACGKAGPGERVALEFAAGRIAAFHKRQRPESWFEPEPGVLAGQIVRPLARVGVYAPGGRAPYPSSVLMTAIPAAVAGVPEIIACTPPGPGGEIPPLVALACRIAGVGRLFRIGGAQAIAAMAVGTDSVPAVDFICGPGNRFVAAAKRLVRGRVGTDLDAGPSEIAVIADASANASWVAWDLLAQAEHDPDAKVALITTSAELAGAVEDLLTKLIAGCERRDVIGSALGGAVAVVADGVDRAIEAVNAWAPEHVALHVEEPWAIAVRLESAGAIMVGGTTPAAVADYVAGSNHVLPTGGTARFSSALDTGQFVRRSNVLQLTGCGVERLGRAAVTLAQAEGLTAHARSVLARLQRGGDGGELEK